MARLWLFNPENDISLASGQANFTPPPAAIEMRRAGELLPLFMADADDRVVCNGVNERWFGEFRQQFGIRADVWNHDAADFTPCPWGWSKASRRYFENIGFSASQLPTDAELDRRRELSHRRTASAVGDYVAAHSSLDIWPRAVEAHTPDELAVLLSGLGRAVVKQPWSSSGRGVKFFDSGRMPLETFVEQTAGTIRRQGSVMVEQFMSAHRDFALLFHCSDGKAVFIGPSVFIADASGNYLGNLVAQDDTLFDILNEIPGTYTLIGALGEALTAIVARDYEGPVGADLCAADGKIHICELNLRYTMGFVARGIARHVGTDAAYMLSVERQQPEGALCLTPPGCNMSFYLTPR